MEEMNLFSEDNLVKLSSDATNQELLDYIASSLTKELDIPLAFKGGYVLNQLIEDSRRTTDVDFSINNESNYDRVKEVLISIGEQLIKLEICDSYAIKDSISPTASGGITFKCDGVEVAGVDVGLHPLDYGICKLNMHSIDTKRFTVERMLADKISTTFTPKRFRRTKDLYDIYVLTNKFKVNLQLLTSCIKERTGELDMRKNPFMEEVLVQYAHAWNKLVIASPDPQKIIKKPEFKTVIDVYSQFIVPILLKNNEPLVWNPTNRNWE